MFFVSKCLVITLLLNKLTDSWSTPLFKVKLPTLLEPRLKLALKTTSPFLNLRFFKFVFSNLKLGVVLSSLGFK